jgi:hypothetical protein
MSEPSDDPLARVTVVQFGPTCGETSTDGFQLIGVRSPPELQRLAPDGALIVVGDPIIGLESLIDSVRTTLPTDHHVIGFRSCHSTAWFWEEVPSVSIEEVVTPDLVVDGCLVDQDSIVRRSLNSIPTGA